METIKSLFQSSTGEGMKLRITSFVLLAIPYAVDFINAHVSANLQIISDPIKAWFDAFFVVLFGIIHAYAWFRSFKKRAITA